MSDDLNINENPRRRPYVSHDRYPIMVFGVGLILTVFTFFLTYFDVQDLLQQDYEYKSIGLTHELEDSLADLKYSIRTTGSIVRDSWQHTQDEQFLKDIVVKSNRDLEHFDHVFWLYQTEQSEMRLINLHINPSFGAHNVAMVSNQLDAIGLFVEEQNIVTIDRGRVVLDMPLFDELVKVVERTEQYRFFAFMQPLQKGNMQAGVIVGIANIHNIMAETALASRYNLATLLIEDNATGTPLFTLNRDIPESEIFDQSELERRIEMGHGSWRLNASFMTTDHVSFTQTMPWIVLLSGFCLSIVGVFIARNTSGQEQVLEKINAELEQKNYQLEDQITEKQRLNSALTLSEFENRAIIDSVSEIISEITPEGEIKTLNAAWEAITGFAQGQFVGTDLFAALHPQDQDRQRKELQMMVSGQKHNTRSIASIRSMDGTFRTVEISLSFLKGLDQKNRRVVATIMDIEERRRAEKALHEAEQKYRTIVENAAGGIFQLTPEGLYLSANPALARLLGYDSPEDVLLKVRHANDDVYGDARARSKFNRELEIHGMQQGHEVQVRKQDGSMIWVNENIRVVSDEGGHVLYYEGSLEDITERMEANIALTKAKTESDIASRAKSDFLANMSHELRTPLNSIIGFSEIIKDEVFGKLEQRQYWDYANDIHASGKKLLEIINEILDISKIDAGERQLNESVVNLKSVATSCIALMHEKIENGKVTVNTDFDHAPPLVAEELSVKQMTMNLLSNAVKYTQEGGSVILAAKVNESGALVYSVTDTGIGMSADEVEKAMSAFGQLDNALSRSGSGTGLGLTLVRSLTELHGGEVEMISEKGLGTTVNIIFPASRVSTEGRDKADDNVVQLKG